MGVVIKLIMYSSFKRVSFPGHKLLEAEDGRGRSDHRINGVVRAAGMPAFSGERC